MLELLPVKIQIDEVVLGVATASILVFLFLIVKVVKEQMVRQIAWTQRTSSWEFTLNQTVLIG